MTRDENMFTEAAPSEDSLDIAIVGMAGRFPGSASVEAFWRNLEAGVESITFFTDDELRAAGVPPALLADPAYVKARPLLPDADMFDAAFFGYTPREAEIIDPQQRVFLECAWEALEDAGYAGGVGAGVVGVFAGATLSTYLLFNLIAAARGQNPVDAWQIGIGNEKDSLPTRVSYLLDLRGPSVDVQSACSTSLVAVHLACQSLLSYQSDLALAGGVSIRAPQQAGYAGQDGLWSTDGHCRPFDARATGMIIGDGAGVVVLKRLADALADRDHVYAVIKGSAVNNDGAQKVGYTAPGLSGQEAVIRAALAIAGTPAESIRYVETHGTGTPLGDSIEIGALTRVFGADGARKQYCAIGSLKSNVGHLDNAAGVAGLIKAALALERRRIPPSLNFERPNPQIDFANSPFYVNTKLAPWPDDHLPRRAGVSAFGIGGTNAHAILEEAPPAAPSGPSRPWQILTLSARTEPALTASAQRLTARLAENPPLDLADVAFTCNCGRRAFDQRGFVVCRDAADAQAALAGGAAGIVRGRPASAAAPAIVFMFPGVGDHYADMAAGLYQAEPTFRRHVDECAELLLPRLGLDLRALLYTGRRDQRGDGRAIDLRAILGRGVEPLSDRADPLRQARLAQPIVFVVEYALAQLLMSWGVRPHALIGHSLGEYVAATIAGVFALDDALMIVAERARLIAQSPPGAMLAVTIDPDALGPLVGDDLALAIVNGPAHCVVAGAEGAVAEAEARLAAQGVACRRVPTDRALHSPIMRPLSEPFRELLAGVALHAPQLPYISNVTGEWITAGQAQDPAYWAAHMCGTVRFGDGLALLLREREQILLEVGPGQSLGAFAKRHPLYQPDAGSLALATLPYSYESQPDQEFLLTALGQIWLAGAPVDWAGFYAHERRRRVPLPTYPFERQRHWVDPPAGDAALAPIADERRADLADWFYLPAWRQTRPIRFLHPPAAPGERGCVLAFVGESSLGERIVERLGQAHEVVTVRAGGGFIKVGPGEYRLSPGQADDYEALLDSLCAQGQPPRAIVHLWGLAPGPDAPPPSSEQAQQAGFYSLLALAQALGARSPASPATITVIADGIQRLTGAERLRPENALLAGACKVIPLEYPHLRCQVIDADLPRPGSAQEQALAGEIAAEVAASAPAVLAAYRDGRRWVQEFEPIRLPEETGPVPLLRAGGVYLLLGGLGGLGLTLAQRLAALAPGARLALLGRSGLPPEDAWPGWLASHDEQDPVSKAITALRQLAEAGAETLVVRADLASADELRAAIQQIRERFGPINGVIHCAGGQRGGLIALKTAALAAETLGPKVAGLRNVEALLGGEPLDFLALCSSINALRGRIGQVDHCASFAFMDSFAHYYAATYGTPAITIQWPAWREVGLAANIALPALEAARREILKDGLTPQEGSEAFERALRCGMGQLAVSPRDLRAVLADSGGGLPSDLAAPGERAAPNGGRHARPALRTAYDAPRDEAERTIAEIWQDLLGLDGLGRDDSFIELGGHSLLAIQALARLHERMQADIPLGAFFETPTIAGLATRLRAARGHPADDRDMGVI